MAQASDIKWGSYRQYEGPFYHGKNKYHLPEGANENDKIMAVITATEGGRYDAYNGYDKCICTSGLIQWCESGQYSVSDMLGKVADLDVELLTSVTEMAAKSGYELGRNKKGRYRFFHKQDGEVDTIPEQRELFLLESSGKKGDWDDASRQYAKEWAAAISTVWEDPRAQTVQNIYTSRRLMGFVLKASRGVIEASPNTSVGKAFKAAYLSFAANNPTWASRHLQKALKEVGTPWTMDWLIGVLKELTFGPKVTIYPHRYKAIRPVLERLYGVDLPDLDTELKKWESDQPHNFFYDTKEVQQGLLNLGYDLGPWGADGSYGDKTRDAILLFEQADFGEKNKVPQEHVDGMMDEYTAAKMEEVLEQRGIELLTG
jgi:peptidoglycan hydrolase-like protein with peptidoglycan-binding domain